jgi:hypothetical protein
LTIGKSSILNGKVIMNNTLKIIVGFFVVIGVALLSYQLVGQWHKKEMATALNNQREKHQLAVAQFEKQIVEFQNKLNEIEEKQVESQPAPPTEALSKIFGHETQIEALGSQETDCTNLNRQTKAFFAYIDQQNYLAEGGFSTPFAAFFQESMQLLAKNPPTLVAEMNDIFLLAKNVSHLYRTLGSRRLKVLKNIIDKEHDVLEPTMAVFYGWLTTCRKNNPVPKELPQLKTMYQYAGFFLTTLGGRSYLLRRDSVLRILVNYYSVLIIDLANDEKLNTVGFDIRNHIDLLYTELSNHSDLIYRDRYLAQLEALKTKYQQP